MFCNGHIGSSIQLNLDVLTKYKGKRNITADLHIMQFVRIVSMHDSEQTDVFDGTPHNGVVTLDHVEPETSYAINVTTEIEVPEVPDQDAPIKQEDCDADTHELSLRGFSARIDAPNINILNDFTVKGEESASPDRILPASTEDKVLTPKAVSSSLDACSASVLPHNVISGRNVAELQGKLSETIDHNQDDSFDNLYKVGENRDEILEDSHNHVAGIIEGTEDKTSSDVQDKLFGIKTADGSLKQLPEPLGENIDQNRLQAFDKQLSYHLSGNIVSSTLDQSSVEAVKVEVPSKKEYKCRVCGSVFDRSTVFKNHFQEKHEGVDDFDYPFDCKLCDGRFKTYGGLWNHERKHSKSDQHHRCDTCGLFFLSKVTLEKHSRSHANSHLKCRICGKVFESAQMRKRHALTHTNAKVFRCDVCSKGFFTKEQLRQHSEQHGEAQYHCDDCGKDFVRVDNYRAHQNTHERCKCDTCGRRFGSVWQLAAHKRIHTGERPYHCKVCNKSFTAFCILKVHRRQHGPNERRPRRKRSTKDGPSNLESKQDQESLDPNYRPYICEFCGKAFRKRPHLNDHVRLHTGETPYSCKLCSASFKTGSGLSHHRRREHVPKPTGLTRYIHKCGKCGKLFSQLKGLKNHEAIHSGKTPFRCDMCDKKFSLDSSLRSHLRRCHDIHSRALVRNYYPCEICHRSFTYESYLEKHKVVHTGEKRFKCHICGKRFFFDRSLSEHLLRHELPEGALVNRRSCRKRPRIEKVKGRKSSPTIGKDEKDTKINVECGNNDNDNDETEDSSGTKELVDSALKKKGFHGARKINAQIPVYVNPKLAGKLTTQAFTTPDGRVRYDCSECDRTFSSRTLAKDHQNIHTGLKPYKCIECSLTFVYASALSLHKRKHRSPTDEGRHDQLGEYNVTSASDVEQPPLVFSPNGDRDEVLGSTKKISELDDNNSTSNSSSIAFERADSPTEICL